MVKTVTGVAGDLSKQLSPLHCVSVEISGMIYSLLNITTPGSVIA